MGCGTATLSLWRADISGSEGLYAGPLNSSGGTAALPYCRTPDCRRACRIRHSVLLLSGERSPRVFHVITEELARCLAAAVVVTVPGAGHDMHAGHPAAYNPAA